LKQTWTMIELDYLEDLEVRENCLDAMRWAARVEGPFWKLRYACECCIELLKWMYWDMCWKREWFSLEPTEEFRQAKQQKFADFKWLCKSEKWIWEYTFRIEWVLGIWTTQKVDIELTAVASEMKGWMKLELEDIFVRYMNIDCEKKITIAEHIIASAPVVFMKDVGLRMAQLIKRVMEEGNKATVTLIEKEENTEAE